MSVSHAMLPLFPLKARRSLPNSRLTFRRRLLPALRARMPWPDYFAQTSSSGRHTGPCAKHFSSATESRLDFVRDQQRAIFPAKLLSANEEIASGSLTAFSLNGLNHERGHVA